MDIQQSDDFVSAIATALAGLISEAIEEAKKPNGNEQATPALPGEPQVEAPVPEGGIVMEPPSDLDLGLPSSPEAQIEEGGIADGEAPLGAPSADLDFLGENVQTPPAIIDDSIPVAPRVDIPEGQTRIDPQVQEVPAPEIPDGLPTSSTPTDRDPEGTLGRVDVINEEGRYKVEPEILRNAELTGDLGDRLAETNKQMQALIEKMIDSIEDSRKRITDLESRLERDRGYYY